MFCQNCGKPLEEGAVFCIFCGAKAEMGTNQKTAVHEVRTEGKREEALDSSMQVEEKKEILSGLVLEKREKEVSEKKKYMPLLIVCAAVIVAVGSMMYFRTEGKKEGTGATVSISDSLMNQDLQTYTGYTEEGTADEAEYGAYSIEKKAGDEPEDDFSTQSRPEYASLEEMTGHYIREGGPASGIAIWSVDENGVMFAALIGSGGYLSYRDMRDCMAEWTDETTAVYGPRYEYGGRIQLHFEEDHTISVEEWGIDSNEVLSLSGRYVMDDDTVPDDFEFVLPDSGMRFITEKDLEHLGAMECKIARNEIYARHGRMFSDEQLQNYFDCCSWYTGEIPADVFDIAILNDYERENAEIIAAYEEKMGWRR